MEKKKIVLTGGGTMGHVTPNLALIPHLLKRGYEIHYIGTANGMEADAVRALPDVAYHVVKCGKLRRYFSWTNLIDPIRVVEGAGQAAKLLGKINPNVVFSKGGFVSVPVVIGAWLHHVPVLCHESDLTPGLANKICRPFAKKFATTYPECAEVLGPKAEMTGTPLRPELFYGDRSRGLSLAGFSGGKPVLLMIGGSSGAQAVNSALRAALPELTEHFDIVHICGKGNLSPKLTKTPGYSQFDFLSTDLPDIYACADIVLSRAGSNSLEELRALCLPMLLVPYPKGAGRGDQELNAQSLESRSLCHVLRQEQMNAQTLTKAILDTWEDRENLSQNLRSEPPANGTARILELIEEIQKKP